jgi:hypothetical protein
MEHKVKDGQSIFDLSIMLYGSIESTFDLIAKNPEVLENITTIPGAGNIVNYDFKNNNVSRFFREEKIDVNTSDPLINDGAAFSDGFSLGFS